jgi:hypothetical protein
MMFPIAPLKANEMNLEDVPIFEYVKILDVIDEHNIYDISPHSLDVIRTYWNRVNGLWFFRQWNQTRGFWLTPYWILYTGQL